MYEKSIFVFRRDLRLVDNTGLIQALNNSKYVIPCFIYDENILKSKKNSEFRCNFLNESLVELDDQLKKKKSSLQIFHGKPEKIINDVIQSNNVDAVFLNTDFTDYSIKRDDKINKVCKNTKIDFHSTLDYLLHNPNDIKTNDEKPYTIYSHFYKKARQYTVRKVLKNSKSNFYSNSISKESIKSPTESVVSGGRNSAIQILKNLHNFRNYDKARNYPWMDSTTKLSAHNKFGTVSVREVYHATLEKLGKDHTLM
ncbi:MAG: deoxyribodipyrimidine photo-lyase, partial [Nitrosopumilus sp.]|nr:deoxyribodipyrimidine photo-lyase [Nitrosopumilus sp.]